MNPVYIEVALLLLAFLLMGAYIYWILVLDQPKTANTAKTSKQTILGQMNEPRPLPMGQKEFVEWSNRIISGALIPCDDRDSLVGCLAAMLMNLGPTESHKPDAYFIHALRKAAINEVAHANFQELKQRKAARAEAEKKEAEADKAGA